MADQPLRLGLLADVHYADKDAWGARHYRDSLPKLRQALETFDAAGVDAVVQLGDLIDSADLPEVEAGYLRTIAAEMARFPRPVFHVLGNHCVWSLTKPQFREICPMPADRYSMELRGWRLVVLDGCWRADGQPYGQRNFRWEDAEIHPDQQRWLAEELRAASGPVLVFVHQRLDTADHYAVRSAAQVRRILRDSGRVRAVVQGHYHAGDFRVHDGIPCFTLAAMIEGAGLASNAFAILEAGDGAVRLAGYGRQRSL